jgi:hypothetical protein
MLFGALLEISDQLNDNSEQQKLLWGKKGKSVLYLQKDNIA